MAFLEEDKKKKNIGTETSFSRFFFSLSLFLAAPELIYILPSLGVEKQERPPGSDQ